MGKIKRWAVEPDRVRGSNEGRLVDIRMAEKFGVKPTYENWEFDEAFVELGTRARCRDKERNTLPGDG